MATSKSTVVGIRLDHERRAWVEAEAARLGVSVRGLFEGMIDEARSSEADEADRAIAGLDSAAPSVPPTRAEEIPSDSDAGHSTDAAGSGGVNAESSLPLDSSSPGSAWSGIGMVTALPTGVIREAFSLTAGLIELSGRCATNRLERCVLTRRFAKRSL